MTHATLQEVVIAALLHDIGKFAQRAGKTEYKDAFSEADVCTKNEKNEYAHQHATYTLGFLEAFQDCLPIEGSKSLLKAMAAYHHNPAEVEHYIITYANRLSRGIEGRPDDDLETENMERIYGQPLVNIASTLHFQESLENTQNQGKFVPIMPLEGESLVAKTPLKLSKMEYSKQWELFESDFRKLKGLGFNRYVPTLLSLLERYTWCIPSSIIEPDISLFHHAKTTAAFAACIHSYAETHEDWLDTLDSDNPYLFVQGDMSGIQKYIFDLPTTKYNAKLLRARSFQIWALSLSFAKFITKKFGVPDTNIITFAGGRFLLLLPKTASYKEMIETIQIELDIYMIKEFSGRLSCHLSSTSIESKADLLTKQGLKLQFMIQREALIAKNKKLQRGLQTYGAVLEEEYADLQQFGECPVCAVKSRDGALEMCKGCDDLLHIGTSIVKAGILSFSSDTLLPFGKMVKLSRKVDTHSWGYTNRVFEPGYPMVSLPYVAPHTGEDESDLLTFEEIAQDPKSGKTKKLAMFKADIDNLGLLFSSTLGTRWSLSRYSELSSQVQHFFSIFLTHLIGSKEAYRKGVYVVFSGGDDLCVLGPWNIIMEFALDFRESLDAFTHANEAVTLSGGIALASSKLPVRNLAAMTEEALEASKHRKEQGLLVKDGITAFGVTLSWSDYRQCLEDGKRMYSHMEKSEISSGIVYGIIDFSHRAERVREGVLRDLLWASNYQYQISRNIDKKNETIRQWFSNLGSSPEQMIRSRISASYALYLMRDR